MAKKAVLPEIAPTSAHNRHVRRVRAHRPRYPPALAARLRRASPARAVRSKTDVAMRSISSYLPADTYNSL